MAWVFFDKILGEFEKPKSLATVSDTSLMIIMGAALAIDREKLYTIASKSLSQSIPFNYAEADEKRHPMV